MSSTKGKQTEYQRQYYLANRERIRARTEAHQSKPEVRERRKQAAKRRYAEKRDEILAYSREYVAEHREERRRYRHQHYLRNKEKANAQTAEYYRKHRERHAKITAAWKKAHPDLMAEYQRRRRASRKGSNGKLTRGQWTAVKAAYGNRCAYCQRKMKHLTQDHVIPLSQGGDHRVENIVPACVSCNSRKQAKILEIVPEVRLML